MIQNRTLLSLFSLIVMVCAVQSDEQSDKEQFALTRDGLARDHPDALFNGFVKHFIFLQL